METTLTPAILDKEAMVLGDNEYYVLDNGDVLEAWRTAKYNGARSIRYTAREQNVGALVSEFDYTFSEFK